MPAMPENSVTMAPDAGDHEAAVRDPGPGRPVALPDQRAVAASGGGPEPHRQLLDDVQDRHQQDLEEQERIAPARPALGRRDEASDIRIGQHHHESRACGLEVSGQARQGSAGHAREQSRAAGRSGGRLRRFPGAGGRDM